jgi:hypothetical protein
MAACSSSCALTPPNHTGCMAFGLGITRVCLRVLKHMKNVTMHSAGAHSGSFLYRCDEFPVFPKAMLKIISVCYR